MELLTARTLLINGNTVFLTAEQFKKETESLPAGNTSFDYNYNYKHKSDMVFGLNPDGSKKFAIELAKDFSARNFDRQFYSGYFICHGKLTVIYYDHTEKYMPGDYNYGSMIPVLVQITNDGLLQSPVVFKDHLRLGSGNTLYPSLSVQDAANNIKMLMVSGSTAKVLTVNVAD